MRSPLRWKLRTLMIVVAVAALCFTGIALRRRAERFRKLASGYTSWESRLPEMLTLFDDSIKRDRGMLDLDIRSAQFLPKWGNPDRIAKESARIKRRVEIRGKFIDLQEDCRRRKRDYSYAARHPWVTVVEGPPVGQITAALGVEFFSHIPNP